MANGQGGPRVPRQPSPVSGPGAMSKRTDGQTTVPMTGMGYGENADFNDMQSSAPLNASGVQGPRLKGKSAPAAGMGGGMSATPLFSETGRPDEPVTAGAPFGPGAGEAPLPNSNAQATADAQTIGRYLPDLMKMAEQDDTPAGFKRFVRHLRNIQGA